MKLAIRGKILAGMFAVVAVFAACGGFSMFQAQSVAGKARSFIEDDWAATDLIMETRITLGEVAKTVTAPPADLDAEGYIRETRQALAQIEEAFRASVLDAETVEEINHLLERSAAYLVEPLSTYAEPMDRMEAADASAEAVMDAIGPLGSIELARTLSTATMTFNDVLISGDLEEFVRFDEAASAMEEHPDYETFREPFLRYRASAEAVFDAAMELDEARGIFLSSADTLDQTLEEFEERFAATVVEPEKADILARLASIVWVLLGAILVAAVIGLLIGYFLARSIARPMARTVEMIEEMERGHLEGRLRLQRNDEIGRMARAMDAFADSLQNEVVDALQRLARGDLTFEAVPRDEKDLLRGTLKTVGDDLNGVMLQVHTSGQQIASGAAQVSDSGQTLSQGATTQASSLEEISASMSEMTAQTSQSAENAAQADKLSSQVREAAERGHAQMGEMVGAMGEINEAGRNISKIIKVIDEIAFQTNLLALNAAVEAARAGQHGKGFAVVAEEVRNLAARSAKAAKETAELIEGSVEKTENGTQIADRTAEALKGIVEGIAKVTGLATEISVAASEQAEGFSQINQGLSQIDQVTQNNTASAEESAAAAEELSAQAAQMQQMLARFQLRSLSGRIEPVSLPDTPPPLPEETTSSWEEMLENEAPPQAAPAGTVIALDDDEFGKY